MALKTAVVAVPVKIPDNLPAATVLAGENIFIMSETRAYHQDIRPLKILILNLMPTKIVTEIQILRLLSNSPLQVEVTLLHPNSYTSKNTPAEHLVAFYKTFGDIRHDKFDGMIITGAPVEHLDFEEVAYWEELSEILDWKAHNVTSTMHVCWGAQAGLYHLYGIPKYPLESKMFGIFKHKVVKSNTMLLKGFDDEFYAPHSRHTWTKSADLERFSELEILSESETAGLYIAASKDGRQIFVTGHPEYDPLTLRAEYDRDINKGLTIEVPVDYFPGDNPALPPMVRWRSHANLLYSNWLNYYVYQATPFDLGEIQ